jgi:hypothetical protein
LEHVDSSEGEPECPVVTRYTAAKNAEGEDTGEVVQVPYTANELLLLKEWKENLREWKQGEAIVKQQVAATIPDSLFMKICDKRTAREIWEALQSDFQNKSKMVAVDLRHRLQQEQCTERGDVRAHFTKLRTMKEDLAAMGHPPSKDEFYAIILGSLPPSYEPFISAMNATSSVLGTFLSSDNLM